MENTISDKITSRYIWSTKSKFLGIFIGGFFILAMNIAIGLSADCVIAALSGGISNKNRS